MFQHSLAEMRRNKTRKTDQNPCFFVLCLRKTAPTSQIVTLIFMSSADKLISITSRIDVQETRIQQRDHQQLKALYDKLCQRELQMREQISQEKARNELQQLEIERRQNQLDESTTTIRRLQEELEVSRKTANGVLWELEESELTSKSEAEIGDLRNKVSLLEARLKKKKVELELAQETMKSQMEALHREILELKAEKRGKEAEIGEMREKLRESEPNGQKREYLDKLNQKLGSLETQNESFRGKVGTLEKEGKEKEQRYKQSEEEKAALQRQINSLMEQLSASAGSSNLTFSRLTEEIDRVKQQKAQLRCEHVQLKRKYAELEAKNDNSGELRKEVEQLRAGASELRDKVEAADAVRKAVENENERLRGGQKAVEREFKEKLEKMQQLVRENEECESSRSKLLQSELDFQKRKCDEMKRTVAELDKRCNKLTSQLRVDEEGLRKAQSENESLKKEMAKLSGKLTENIRMEDENASLRDRSKWLSDKIVYLESELKETSTDHRTELAKLAHQLGTSASVGTCQGKGTEKGGEGNASNMEARQRQQETELRAMQRKLEQCEKENSSMREERDKVREEALKTKQENVILRQNFDLCLKKAETFKCEMSTLKEVNEQLKSENEREKNSVNDQLYELRADLEQKEKLIAYLQSVVQPKQMQKLPRHRSSLLSDGNDLSEIEMEYKQCLKLEQERNQLKMNLESRRRVLDEKQNELTPIRPMVCEDTAHSDSSPTRCSQTQLKNSSTESTLSAHRFPGRMRHDIPHLWKRHFVTVATNKCQACLDGLPHFRLVLRCRDCSLTVHPHCRSNVVNTCGLPRECANFYLDTHSTSCEKMTGWVKLWRLPTTTTSHASDGAAQWQNAWALFDDNRLSFYDSDQLAVSEGALPFLSIDLDRDHWRIYNQTTDKPLNGVRGDEMSMLIELKLPDYILFMLAPTVQAKQRWVHSLQMATSRRVFVQRRHASTIVTNSLLLALDRPRDLSINSTAILRDEWLLLGAQEGLFATSMAQQQLRAPFQISGLTKICWMEMLPEFDMLLAICGVARHLAVIHLQQLHRAFRVEQQPAVSCTNIANIEQCHIAVVSKSEHHRDKRFVYIATIDEIVVLQFIAKLGFFSPVTQIKTEEPCTCICSTSFGFVFGSDNFHFARFDDNFAMPSPLVVENCPFDFPVAAVEISDNEFLLAFHNFGLFVNSQGKRSRNKNIEWEKVPLEFVYTSPFLYIAYCEFLEVVRVAPFIGPDSSTVTDDRSLFRCRAAHRTGHGPSPGEVLFAVSSDDRVELHTFGHADQSQQQAQQQPQSAKSILKRKMADTSAAHPSSGSKRKY